MTNWYIIVYHCHEYNYNIIYRLFPVIGGLIILV